MTMTRAVAVLAAAGFLTAAVSACGSPSPSPMQRYIAAHPAVPCPVIAAQVRALNRYNRFPGPASNPYAAEQALAARFANVSAGASKLAAAEAAYENDTGWLRPGSPGYSVPVLNDVATLASLC